MNGINRKITIGFSLLILTFLIIMGIWYAGRFGRQPVAQPSPSSKPFSEKNQFVPKGAASLEVSKALASFHFLTPLPFFDERNVVQSLNLQPSATSSPQMYLSYRIFKQSRASVQEAFIQYFKNMGWEMVTNDNRKDQRLTFFLREPSQHALVTFFDVPHVPGTEESAILVVLSM